jgi:hypothetical protein
MTTWQSLTAVCGALLALMLAPLDAATAHGPVGSTRSVATTSWVEEWDPAAQRWVRISESPAAAASSEAALVSRTTVAANGAVITETVITPHAPFAFPRQGALRPGAQAALAQYGPFRVLDDKRAALVAATDVASPRHFDAMLRDYPGLAVLEMPDAPGTSHDLANLALGRRIRAAGLETHVPAGGSVRSGAVELFLAGTRQTMAAGATFAVHSWMDTRGLEPRHFAEDAPENRLYLDYYEEMGMAPDHARAFYAMTNSVPHSGALWLDTAAMQRWIAPLAEQSGEGAPRESLPGAIRALAVVADDAAAAPPAIGTLYDPISWPLGWDVLEIPQFPVLTPLPAPVLTPVLVWSEPAVVTLARLDSLVIFP